MIDQLKLIPGVFINGGVVSATPDVAPFLHASFGISPTIRPVRPSGVRVLPIPLDVDLTEKLHPWQKEGALALARDLKRALFFATGLGKTASALEALRLLSVYGKVQGPHLIITRAMGRLVYARDLSWIWPGEKVSVIIGAAPTLGDRSKAQEYAIRRASARLGVLADNCEIVGSLEESDPAARIVVVGWETLHHHVEVLRKKRWDRVVFDESHMSKGYKSQRFEAAEKLRYQIGWLLTATPVRDRVRDLAPQCKLMSKIAWGSTWKFVQRYCGAVPTAFGGLDTTGVSNKEELAGRMAWWSLAKRREEIAHLLPAATREIIRIPPKAVEGSSRRVGENRRGLEAAIGRACAAKTSDVAEYVIEALQGGEKVILVGNRRAWAPKTAISIESKLRGQVRRRLWCRWATGEISVADRQAIARDFVEVSGPALLVATIDSISESIDLQDADLLAIAALPYTPGQVAQLEGRVVRMGMNRPVRIVYFVAEGTIDEVIEDRLLDKLGDIEGVGLETMGAWGDVEEGDLIGDLCSYLNSLDAGVVDRAVLEAD